MTVWQEQGGGELRTDTQHMGVIDSVTFERPPESPEDVFDSRHPAPQSRLGEISLGALSPEPRILTHDRFGPIRKQVAGLGEIEIVERQEYRGRRQNDAVRIDRWYRIELDGYRHGVRVTEADEHQNSGVTIVHLPGFTETIEDSAGKEMHDALVSKAPHLRVVSIATDGIGHTGDPVHARDALNHSIDAMAERRHKLLKALVGDQPFILLGTSMGSFIANKVLDYDLKHGHDLNAYPINHASAIVTPNNTLLYMGVLFLPSMAVDTPREILDMLRSDGLKNALEKLQIEGAHHRGGAAAMVIQAAGLLQGIPYSQIERVAKAYSGAQISGQFDPLAQFGMWRDIRRDLRHNPTHSPYGIEMVPFRGHGMAADGEDGAAKVLKTIRNRQVIERLLAA